MMQFLKNIFLPTKSLSREEKELFSEIKNSFVVNGELLCVGQLLKHAYQKYSENTALIGTEKTITYKELYFRSVSLSLKLKNFGVESRDRVILYFENSLEFYVAYFAIWQIGAVVVPLNIFLHEKELSYVIKDCQAVLAIVSDSLKEKWDKLEQDNLIEKLPMTLSGQDIDWGFTVPEKIEDLFPDFEIENLDSRELCLLLYTSGTTGVPKGVMLSSKNVLTNAMQAYARLNLVGKEENERFFSVLPLFHVFAQNTCIWLPVMTGSAVIIVNKIDRKLIVDGLQKKPTIFLGFPALYGMLCLLKTAPLDSIRLFVSGADMLPDKIRYAFAAIYGRKICSGYGLTEASPVTALNYHNENMATQVVGDLLIGIDCDIRDEDEKSLKPGQIGTLWIRGDNIMMGYYNAPEATNKVLRNGWLNTGDLASIDEKGKLAIQGRSKDLIIHKGFNIYPQEVENILMTHPCVFKAAVIGREEGFSGQVPIAYVAVRGKDINIENSLKELCSNNLAQYKIPRQIICLEDLPLNATGKVDKKKLQIN